MFGQDWQEIGFWFLFSLVLALWAVFHIIGSERASPLSKALWTVLVLFVPVLGFVIWLIFGPRASR